MRWLVRLCLAVVLSISAALVAFDSSTLQDRGWWRPPEPVLFASIGGVALSIIWQFVDAEWERRRVRRRTALAHEITKIMFPVWYRARTAATGRKTQERIGVHVWMVPTWHWNLLPDWVRELCPEAWRARFWTPRLWRGGGLLLRAGRAGGGDN